MADGLTFVINPAAERTPIALLEKSLVDIRRLLRHVGEAMYGPSDQIQWVVSELRSSAPTITLQPERGDGRAVEAVGYGMRVITAGTDEPPQYFTEQALEDVKKMRRLFRGKASAESIFVLTNGERSAVIEEDISDKVSRILTAGYHNLGSLEGRMDAINVHGSPAVTIWDRVTGAPVRCRLPEGEEWITRAKDLLRKRVLVAGDVHYFVNGAPRSILDVTDLEDASPDPSLPRAEFGSIPDKRVLEVGAAEWLKSVRGIS